MSVEQPSTKRSKKADAKANASGSTVSAAVDVNDHKHLNASLTLLRTQDTTFAGVKGAGNNVAAPQYIRAACNAALPYGRDDEIPQVHIDAYHASAMPEDDDLARAVAILTADAEEGSDVE